MWARLQVQTETMQQTVCNLSWITSWYLTCTVNTSDSRQHLVQKPRVCAPGSNSGNFTLLPSSTLTQLYTYNRARMNKTLQRSQQNETHFLKCSKKSRRQCSASSVLKWLDFFRDVCSWDLKTDARNAKCVQVAINVWIWIEKNK